MHLSLRRLPVLLPRREDQGEWIAVRGGRRATTLQKRCTKGWDGNPSHEGGELITQSNPTCWSATYAGGLSCCGHKRILLDADQDPGPTLLRYHMKWRFWFQEYKNATEVVSSTSTSTASSLCRDDPPVAL